MRIMSVYESVVSLTDLSSVASLKSVTIIQEYYQRQDGVANVEIKI
jgi:hypothetical protein